MISKKHFVAISIAATACIPGIASADYAHVGYGEASQMTHDDHWRSTTTRDAVRGELISSQRALVGGDPHPALSRGEAGWSAPGHALDLRGGRLTHSDGLSHEPSRTSAVMSDEEKRRLKDSYLGG